MVLRHLVLLLISIHGANISPSTFMIVKVMHILERKQNDIFQVSQTFKYCRLQYILEYRHSIHLTDEAILLLIILNNNTSVLRMTTISC